MNATSLRLTLLGAVLGAGLIAGGPALADPTATEIIRSLAPIAPDDAPAPQPRPRRRTVTVEIEGRPASVDIDLTRTVDLVVYFPYDSAVLTPEARRQLRALGEALASPELERFRYLVAGHTDAKGDADYNRILSFRRAHAVRRYLVEAFGIDPRRLIAVGWGEAELKNPADPHDQVNRRVEIALVADIRVHGMHRPAAYRGVAGRVRPGLRPDGDGRFTLHARPGARVTIEIGRGVEGTTIVVEADDPQRPSADHGPPRWRRPAAFDPCAAADLDDFSASPAECALRRP